MRRQYRRTSRGLTNSRPLVSLTDGRGSEALVDGKSAGISFVDGGTNLESTELPMADTLREFTREELRGYDGQDGKPVYVAYEGRVYDLSESKMWRTGTHMKKHAAGTDLTGEIGNVRPAPSQPIAPTTGKRAPTRMR